MTGPPLTNSIQTLSSSNSDLLGPFKLDQGAELGGGVALFGHQVPLVAAEPQVPEGEGDVSGEPVLGGPEPAHCQLRLTRGHCGDQGRMLGMVRSVVTIISGGETEQGEV